MAGQGKESESMTTTQAPPPVQERQHAPEIPAKNLPPVPYRDLPEAPPLRKVLGPSVILVGVGIATGEYILWPYISSQVGLVFMWAVPLGVLMQYFINMEVERYTLATGETAVAGFIRMWKPLGIVMCACALIPNIWPAWAVSSSTVLTFLVGGGNANTIALCALLAIGLTLTISPVVYKTLESIEFVKIGAVLVFLAVAVLVAIGASDWGDTGDAVTHFGQFPGELEIALILGAFAFAGAGGTNNLVQSNWIRDKGFGMGRYAPRIVSPVTGEEEAAPATGVTFRPTRENMRRWNRWWSVANKEQFFAFFVIGTLTIIVFSMVAYSTVYGQDLGEDLDFIQGEGNALKDSVGAWFGSFFWAIGALSLFAASIGIADYVSRLVADVLKVGYLRESKRWSESRIYSLVVWTIVLFGVAMIAAGFDQPLVLTVLAASLSGVVMFIYSGLLIALNRRFLPQPIKIRGVRLGALVWCFGFFGVFSIIYAIEQFKQLV
jgi:hypothetical protein